MSINEEVGHVPDGSLRLVVFAFTIDILMMLLDLFIDSGPIGPLLRVLQIGRGVRLVTESKSCMRIFRGIREVFSQIWNVVYVMFLLTLVCGTLVQRAPGISNSLRNKYFSSCMHIVRTLLSTGVFLDSTSDFFQDVSEEEDPLASLLLTIIFLVYITVVGFILVNMTVGIVCQTVVAEANLKTEQREIDYISGTLGQLFVNLGLEDDEVDVTAWNGDVEKCDFQMLLKMPEAIAALEDVGIDVASLATFDVFRGHDRLPLATIREAVLRFRKGYVATFKDLVMMHTGSGRDAETV